MGIVYDRGVNKIYLEFGIADKKYAGPFAKKIHLAPQQKH